ncbi:PREDICTED: WD repeat-containing protein 26-like [Ipomoea nil]|uniref:WD repeat-containing protein 26-like n=1 Tax=Ipomoea nil TaxID=35883 RepID=UPI00090151C2|nr:PREDICTED: WD repeat-containing protein 26-like [Ipomoea nil]XP_019162310.1 PREDICTED: WD repeat-containing protein 26-like [Ipomoea nil]XP_019162311.1 PREDICTED: WD repeat-containing protein 26-like [Ipomoea nil]
MGGLEDSERPTKRVKVASRESGCLLNGISPTEPASCSPSNSMARSLAFQADTEVVGSKRVVKKVEFVQIISEALYSLGYKRSGACLEEESGIPLHSSIVKSFMQQILNGKWDESVASLQKIGVVDKTIIKLASFLIFQQKFFELLDGDNVMGALKTLRTEIAPLYVNHDQVRELSSHILSRSRQNLAGISGQQIVRMKSRSELLEELQKLLPPSVMIPEKRLVNLVEQALDLQLVACRFHNSLVGEISLFTDHQCGRDRIPSQTLQILEEHNDEVWFLQFSHDGKYLASSSADCSVIIWEVKEDSQVLLKDRFSGHQKPVSYISWSPDSNQILTCGLEEVVRQWDVASGECVHVYEKDGVGLISCGWSPDGQSIFSGVTDQSISMWSLDGKEVKSWKGEKTIKIPDIGITTDGKQIISVCKDNMISLFRQESNTEELIEEDQDITSFVLSRDNKHLLVSLLNQEIHLWYIGGHPRCIAKFKGHKRLRFVVRSCFGGLNQAFIASGSEDSQVYIWHKSSGELVRTLCGHSGTVNSVSWNPVNPHMLASASDDRTIRIWGLNSVNMKQNGSVSNGVHYCNGRGRSL